MEAGQPLIIEAVRGGVVESAHLVHAAIADRHGRIESWGDPRRPTIPRSAIKAIQALPIITTGAADALDVTAEELALACASHSAEPEHVDAVRAWLDRIGLSEDDLECGPDRPLGTAPREEFYAQRLDESPIYNCCSGKHAGFLTVSRQLGVDTAGYIEPASPAQKLTTAAIESLSGVSFGGIEPGVDGCGIPVFALPLERLAFAMARLVDPVDLDDELAVAAGRMVDAAQLAFWVSGSNRTEVHVSDAMDEPIVIKGGAEGVFMAALPERGLGIALKSADGNPRASRLAIRTLLRNLDALPADDAAVPKPLKNKAGRPIGELRPVIGPGAKTEI